MVVQVTGDCMRISDLFTWVVLVVMLVSLAIVEMMFWDL